MPLDSAQIGFWNDDNTDVSGGALRRDIPNMPRIADSHQVIKGGSEALGYLAWQIVKSKDKRLIIRALASAVGILFQDFTNYTGSPDAVEALSGLEPILDENIDRTTILTTNFKDAEAVTIEEMDYIMSADSDELGAYFGVLFLGGVKLITPDNRSAFNEKRTNLVQATTLDELRIFIPDSQFLADAVVKKMYACFTSCLPMRTHLVSRVSSKMGTIQMGPTAAFSAMFMLLQDNGMSALRIIKEATLKHPWIREEFPELMPEFESANKGFKSIAKAPPATRPFLKAIYGNSYVPTPYTTIDNLTGVCKMVLRESTPTYKNYRGGKTTEAQDAVISRRLGLSGTAEATANAAATQE